MTQDFRPRWDARWVIHLSLTLVLLFLGALLALPGDTFATGLGWHLFAILSPEYIWAVIFWMVGCVGVVGLTSKGWVRLGSVFVLATAHGMLAGMFLYSNPWGAASGIFAILAGQGYYLMLRRVLESASAKWPD